MAWEQLGHAAKNYAPITITIQQRWLIGFCGYVQMSAKAFNEIVSMKIRDWYDFRSTGFVVLIHRKTNLLNRKGKKW